MTDTFTNEAINDLRARVLRAQNGEGEMPSREELLQAYAHLGTARGKAQGAATSRKTKPPVNLPTDLNDLFKD